MKKLPSLLLFSALVSLTPGCRSHSTAAPAPSAAPVVLSAGWQTGETAQCRTVLPGSLVEIRLNANPSTGYSWQLERSGNPDSAVLEKHFYWTPPSDSALCGAPGVDVWQFRAKKKGRAVLKFRYYRQWEKFDPAHDAERIFTIIAAE